MNLSQGARLGAYEIGSAIGAGGMGELYRATDTKLGRSVAIKVLPSALAQDPERLLRFEREAKLLASLNHSNIAHVYGFESATLVDGSTAHFLAMEPVEGSRSSTSASPRTTRATPHRTLRAISQTVELSFRSPEAEAAVGGSVRHPPG